MSKPMIRLSVQLKLKTVEELDRTAKDWNESLSAMMRFMIEHYLRYNVKGKKKEKKGAKDVKNR